MFVGCDKKDWNALVQGDGELFKLKSADSSPVAMRGVFQKSSHSLLTAFA